MDSKRIEKIIDIAINENASDIHFSSGRIPFLRVKRHLISLEEAGIISRDEIEGFVKSVVPKGKVIEFEEYNSIDFAFSFENKARFRANFFKEFQGVSCALRYIPSNIKSIEDLGLPSVLHKFSDASQGLVLITGPTSHGKSTTLASIIQEVNINRRDHIITIEDPIEYIFQNGQSLIHQREIGSDSPHFQRALKDALREDPDVIMVGEMRDPDTMATAISAAETGHLVFSTLHTNSAGETIHRIVDSFPSHQQNQIRMQLASSLLGIVSQRLLPGLDGELIPAVEVLLKSTAVSNLIRENKIHEIPTIIDSSYKEGMVSLNRYLATLVKDGKISLEVAKIYSSNTEELKILLK